MVVIRPAPLSLYTFLPAPHRFSLCVRSRCMKNVIFDVGGVLLEWNPGRIMEGYYADAAERAAMRAAIFLHADWLELDRGTLCETGLLQRVAVLAGRAGPGLDYLCEVV